MANYQIIRRLEAEIRILQSRPYTSKARLSDYLVEEHQIDVTTRTLERDLKALKRDFGIEINFDRSRNGYILNDESQDQIISFLQFAGRIYLGDLLRENLTAFSALEKSVKLEDNSDFKGLDHIPVILSAIQNHFKIRFIHENYGRQTQKPYYITPFQLREYQGRWYVVGLPENENHIKTFGLARLSKLKTLGLSNADLTIYQEQLKKFERIIGLNYDDAPNPTSIELAVSSRQYKYLKTLPLHSSQKFEEDLLNNWVKISLFLIPNYELKMQLLKLGDQVKVLKPESLKMDIKQTLKRSLAYYS